MNDKALRELIQRQSNILVASGTGKVLFDDAGDDYEKTDIAVRTELKRLGLSSPFPWRSLWEWHGFYSQGRFPTYASRRLYVASLVTEIYDQLDGLRGPGEIHDPEDDGSEPTWDGVNARIGGLIQEYSTANDKDTWQDVGRRAREILIDLGKIIADPVLVSQGSEAPKEGDARAWIDLLLDAHASGGTHAEFRALVRKTWDLAQKVTHADITDIDAFAAAQATVMVVRTIQKLLASTEN